MSDESDRPLRDWTLGHIFSFLGIALFAIGGWVVLNERVGKIETKVLENSDLSREYRSENTRRLERIEENQMKLMMAFGVKPQE